MSDEFLLKSVVFKFISEEISRTEHEHMNIHTPTPISTLVSPQITALKIDIQYLLIISWNSGIQQTWKDTTVLHSHITEAASSFF